MLTQFQYRGELYIITYDLKIWHVQTNGSDQPNEWVYQLVGYMPVEY